MSFFFFFFSSRRRHTRYWRDWSSDVCSSDLAKRVDGAHLCARIRPRFEHGGGVHRPAAAQAWRAVYRDGARDGLSNRGSDVIRSLRARLVLGALLWTLGLFMLAGVLVTAAMLHHYSGPGVVHGFFGHYVPVTAAAFLCLGVGVLQVRRGVSPINQLRARLAAVHDGREARVVGGYPAEIEPLVTDLNALLANREEMVRRALAKAGDLAHGLKTPLAVLTHEAEQMRRAGQADAAAAIDAQIERMRRHVDYHL